MRGIVQKLGKVERRSWCCAAIFAVPFSLAMSLGSVAYRTNRVSVIAFSYLELAEFISIFVASLAISLILLACVLDRLAYRKPSAADRTRVPFGALMFISVWALIFLSWIPCLLAYWPGTLPYDMPYQVGQIVSGEYTKFHPPLHTFIIGLSLSLSQLLGQEMVSVYAVIQMVFLSGCFACALKFLAKRGAGRVLFVVSLLFFSVNPVVALFSITPTKDVYFTGFFLVSILELLSLRLDGTRRRPMTVIGVFVSVVLACLFRNNAVFAYAVVAVALVFVSKGMRAFVFFLLSCSIAAYLVILGPLYSSLGIEDGDVNEALSVPLQQVSRVVALHGDELDRDMVSLIGEHLPYEEIFDLYNPRFADDVKTAARECGGDATRFLLEVWLPLGMRYPAEYIDAFVCLNITSWYPLASVNDPYSQRIYIETMIFELDYHKVASDSQLPWLKDLYEQVATYQAFEDVPVISLVFSTALPVWVILFGFVTLVRKRRSYEAGVLVLPLMYWATMLAGPVANMRYQLPLFVLYPLVCWCAAHVFPVEQHDPQASKKRGPLPKPRARKRWGSHRRRRYGAHGVTPRARRRQTARGR